MNLHSALMIAVISIVTMLLRFIPFVIFGRNKKTPEIIIYLGKVLPCAIIAMLVVYCFKTINLKSFPFGLPELVAGLCVVVIHSLKSNTLLSIGIGTILYMVLIQFIFI